MGKTKEYGEKTFWGYNQQQRLPLQASPFWADCVAEVASYMDQGGDDGPATNTSPTCMAASWLHEAGQSVNQALLLLALLDLPFANQMTVQANKSITHSGNAFILTSALKSGPLCVHVCLCVCAFGCEGAFVLVCRCARVGVSLCLFLFACVLLTLDSRV